jgi:Mg-chelatase subunit ChlD
MRHLAPALVLLVLGLPAPARAGDPPDAGRAPAALRPLEAWLGHEDAVLRAMAAFELRRVGADGAVGLAVRRLERETDAIVLGCLVGSLEGRPREDLLAEGGATLPGLLLRLAEHAHPVVRDRAWAVLRRLPRRDPGVGLAPWRRWWVSSRLDLEAEQASLREARREAHAAREEAGAQGGTVSAEAPDDRVYEHVLSLRRDGLEVCIVLDHTGSMAPVIGQAAGRAAALVRRLAGLVPRFRAGLVTYDDQARLRMPLTVDGTALEKAFRKVSAHGGGDWEEGVDKGIALALTQSAVAWSRAAHRVVVLIGDAPPHEGDVAGLLRRIRSARDDELFDHPVLVHAVSTSSAGVDHFGAIAAAGAGLHVTLGNVRRLEAELVALSFGAEHAERVGPWLEEIEHLRRNAPNPDGRDR